MTATLPLKTDAKDAMNNFKPTKGGLRKKKWHEAEVPNWIKEFVWGLMIAIVGTLWIGLTVIAIQNLGL